MHEFYAEGRTKEASKSAKKEGRSKKPHPKGFT
jgi:hypothetical protein